VRGYLVKSGLKFGVDFVVYARGKVPGKDHSKWMIHVVPESIRIDFAELTRAARLATNVKKRILFAIVTERGPVYYEVRRKTM
jgi:tRNA-intron endonuclease